MSKEFAVILLVALAGFLLGGAYTLWKTARTMAIVLLVAAGLAGVGILVWLR